LRTYPSNSPQAAARIVALAMLADGHFCKTELDVLARMDADAHLGLEPEELKAIVHTLCEDLFYSSLGSWGPANLDSSTLNALLAEIDDPELRVKVLELCVTVTEADEHIAEGEIHVLAAASEQWGLPRATLYEVVQR
jgi:uncharacterized tellurite resistance protein B-like protein